jgi:hypothetical protein
MSNVEELKEVLKGHLESNGSLNMIWAQLRANVYQALNEGE